jgi:MoaA/NifB/PqqE/SkfB family radical SAM enzyme
MSVIQRGIRHARLSLHAHAIPELGTPPFLIFFINSTCNLKCEHCFVWSRLNKRDDLTFEEIVALSEDLGPLENLNLSGGEPFMRREFTEICLQFIRRNGVKQIYVPSNGYYTEKTIEAIERVLASDRLKLFAVELSLDGLLEFHNRFRGNPRSFQMAMRTYDALAELQRRDSRLRIHAASTATGDNVEEIRKLTTYLYERCPAMDHHNLAIIRGDRKNSSLQGPDLEGYVELSQYTRSLWANREEGRFGGVVDPMLTWAKVATAREQRQVVPCKAGTLIAVVYANGDVGVCETLSDHPVLGNLREASFRELWNSPQSREARRRIACKACHCTNEVFLWPSVVFQPSQLARAAAGARVWRRPVPLADRERVGVAIDEERLPVVNDP